MTKNEPTCIGPRSLVYKNQYQETFQVRVSFANFQKDLYVNCFGKRAAVLLARTHDVLLIRQYRLLAHGLAWEIPGGKVDAGESPAQAAAREGLEESGFKCKSLFKLLFFHPGLDTHDNPTFIYYSEEFEDALDQNFHPNEISERIWVPLQKCIEMIFSGEIVDSLTIAALLAYKMLKDNPSLAPK
jgi:8-oxo-dGTP pyrophosphatase MutT (NUDIX family)